LYFWCWVLNRETKKLRFETKGDTNEKFFNTACGMVKMWEGKRRKRHEGAVKGVFDRKPSFKASKIVKVNSLRSGERGLQISLWN